MIFFDKLSFIGIIVANTCRAACPQAAENVFAKPYETADPGQAALQSLKSLLHKLSFNSAFDLSRRLASITKPFPLDLV